MLDSLRLDNFRLDCAQLEGPQLGGGGPHASTDDDAATTPSCADGTLIDRSLRPANDQEVVRQMAYVLQSWPGARGRRRGDDALARITAERLVDYLHLSGFELMKRPMATDTRYIGGER